MATNLSKLKSGKGVPPPVEETTDVTDADPRSDGRVPTRPLQVRIPETVFAEFSGRAGKEFGFTHGSKKQLFLKMWEAYKAQNIHE